MSDDLTIGILAKRSGVNVETIRYYQRRHLLEEPSKPLGGYRRYSLETVTRYGSSKERRPSDSLWKRSVGC